MEKGKGERTEARTPVRDFKELETWQVARKLRIAIYCATRNFPPDEKFGLAAQMRRAAVSITANIAEGYGRFSYQENIQFCRQSRASAYELRDHLTTAVDESYFARDVYLELESLAMQTIHLLNGYIRKTKLLQQEKEKR